MRLPLSVKQAREETEKCARFVKRRYPDELLWANESYTAGVQFWT
jgi:dimethylaniline monooxygenase (N-oxide forming)